MPDIKIHQLITSARNHVAIARGHIDRKGVSPAHRLRSLLAAQQHIGAAEGLADLFLANASLDVDIMAAVKIINEATDIRVEIETAALALLPSS